MSIELFMQYAGAAALVLSIVNVGMIVAGRATKPITDKIAQLAAEFKAEWERVDARQNKHSEDLKEHDRRIQAIEGEIRHLPTASQVTELRVIAERLDGHVRSLEGSMEGLGHTVRRMDDFLRERA